MAQMHDFVSVTVIPIHARITMDTEVIEYAARANADATAEQMCHICHAPLTPKTIHEECPGSNEIPDDLSGLSDADLG